MAVSNDKIYDKLFEVSEVVAGMAPIVADLKKAVITGNGHPGLLQRMKTVEDCHEAEAKQKEALGKMKDKRSDFSTKVVLILITMVVSNVGVLLFAIFKP